MFVLEWLHYIIAWCVSHMFQVMANGETFSRSLILSPQQNTPVASKPARATPNRSQSTPKTSLYRRLSARLSGRRQSPSNYSSDLNNDANEDRDNRIQIARNKIKNKTEKDEVTDVSITNVGQSFNDDLCANNDGNKIFSHVEHVEHLKNKSYDKENKNNDKVPHSGMRINSKDKREVFRNKSMNVFNLVDCLTEASSVHSSLTKSLCHLDTKEEPCGLLFPSSRGSNELQQSTTTISSGKKRSRNSTDSNFQVSIVDGNLSPDKSEESHWKTIKRLKIKDSFKFKNRPTIFKRSKKETATKNVGDITIEPVSPDVKPDPSGEYVASTPSPSREDDNTSICSMNTSKQSGFFDISLASIRSSKTIKSASKLRRSVKSFTASFRSERKKKYEKRAERNTIQVDSSCFSALTDHNNVSTPKRDIDEINFDISPVQVDTVDSTGIMKGHTVDVDELDDSVIFKTPQAVWSRTQRHSLCDSYSHQPPPVPTPSPVAREPPPPTSSVADTRAVCHGISLPVLTTFNTNISSRLAIR